MRFINDTTPQHELTYNDVFMLPQRTSLNSRFEVDLTTPDMIGTSIPLVVANMTAVAGKRMAETVARRGGVTVLPQDTPTDILENMIKYIKNCHTVFETPITLSPAHTIEDALSLIYKRAHQSVIIVDDQNKPIGIFTEADAEGFDRFTRLANVMSTEVITISEHETPEQIFEKLQKQRLRIAPVVNSAGELVGAATQKGALRSSLYKPAVDASGKMLVAVAIGINGDVAARAQQILGMGADILVLDTAHGHQDKMIQAIKKVRAVAPKTPIVAGNVVTAEATADLIQAGANIIKVGVGPGAMCTTRMMTGVGRPQFSAVLECSTEARKHGAHVWADGGIRHPRDVALALAAGASNVMFASWLAGTYESAGDIQRDATGRLYKENFGMASKRAVRNRNQQEIMLAKARKELFEEGISSSKLYLDPKRPGVEDIIDQIVAGVRSACSYAGAASIAEFQRKAVVGVQSTAGYREGEPVRTSW